MNNIFEELNKIQAKQSWEHEVVKNAAIEYIADNDLSEDFLEYVKRLAAEENSSINYMEGQDNG